MKVYSVGIEGVITYFGLRGTARYFNSQRDRHGDIAVHEFKTSHDLASFLNGIERACAEAYQKGRESLVHDINSLKPESEGDRSE